MTSAFDHLATLTEHRDSDMLDVTLSESLMDLLRVKKVCLYKLVGEAEDKRWLLRAQLSQNDPTTKTDLGQEWVDLPLARSVPHRQACLESGEVLRTSNEEYSHVTCFPVIMDGESIGVFEVCDDQPLVETHERTVIAILRIYQNFESLLNYSQHDTLTGLLNRKTFDLAFMRLADVRSYGQADEADDNEGEDRRTERVASSFWLGVLDIDHFKQVNDNYGHLIGDEVLLLIARVLRNTFRFGDQLFRFGGEEFVVLLRCNGEEDALAIFERLRHNVEQYKFPQVGHITVSVGVTEVRAGETPVSAFERADRAVYYAKDHGRNQVCIDRSLIQQGVIIDKDNSGDVELF